MELNLQLFSGSLTVTMYKDANMTTASASPASSLATDDTVTLTLAAASGYEVKDVQVLAGGVTVHQDNNTVTFKMGASNVAILVTSQKNNEYRVVENCHVNINGSVTDLKKNVKAVMSDCGGLAGVDCTPTAVTLDAETVKELVASGVLVKDNPKWVGPPTPTA